MKTTKPNAAGGAARPCAPSHRAAVSTITGTQLGQGLERKLVTKINNAWRMYSSGKKNGGKDAVKQLDTACEREHLLSRGPYTWRRRGD